MTPDGSYSGAGSVDVVVVRAGMVRVALPARRVREVVRGEEERRDGPSLHLGAALGLLAPGARAPDTYLWVEGPEEEGDYTLAIDGGVTLRSFDLACLHRLPRVVEAAGRQAGIAGVLKLDEGLIYFMDLDALGRRAAARKGQAGR